MSKSLSEMTLEELWELFPIILSEHKSCWGDWYEEEKQKITALLYGKDPRINHIGSTAINGIWAKPIVDILVEIPMSISMEDIKEKLISGGYICMSEEENRKSFNKGYTEQGFAEKVFHLHLRYYGDNDELYFRDYMNNNPVLAGEYEKLKISLWKKYEHDRDAYTNAKSAFVEKYTRCAKVEYC
ncbi:MAG: GrpB family protein [Lachnospiraceae bacterium]|nr:GrpB family protein [Lachnospiraceae bacterium]